MTNAHKKILTSLAVREMEIKTTMGYHLIPARGLLAINPQMTSVYNDVEEREPLRTSGGNAGWCSHCGK